MFTIVVGTKGQAEIPLLLREDEVAPAGAFRFRVVAQTDDQAEANRILDLLNRRCCEPPSVRGAER